ncbi:protease 2 isoform X2 [Telopea speciosissima]|uniref:protease 2 isoform X2 n=1 Tax=Telopea speciosissima TaxID=54955 RepID=UPI001CC5E787|nr:protease 2 isoform X2 [Telopea speciosissima]
MLLIRRSSLLFSFRLLPRVSSSISFFSSTCNAKVPSFTFPETFPPVPKKIPFTVSAHGRTWEDPYHWMSNPEDPDLSNYLNQENLYAEAFMADTENLQRELLLEMRSRMPPKISTPPEHWGPWLYYQYIPEGMEFPVLCRRLEDCKSGWMNKLVNYVRGLGREQILLDWNEIAQQFGYVHVGMCRVSPDHNFLAYTLDTTGAEHFMLQIKDLRTGCILPKSRVDGVVSLAWAQDFLFYTVSNETQRPYRVLCTRLGSGMMDPNLIFTESDSSCCVDIASTKDGKFITVNSNSRTSSEVYVIDATNPQNVLQRVRKRVPGVQYFLEHHYGFFYILTNASLGEDTGLVGGGYHLARCSAEDIQSATWQDIIVPDQDVNFQDMDIFNGHLVFFLDKRGSPMICSINMPIAENCKSPLKLNDLNPWFFPVPACFCNVAPGSNHDFMTSIYRVVLSSPVMPDVIIDYDMLKQKFLIVQQEEIMGVCGSTRSDSRTSASKKSIEKLLGMHTHNDQSILNVGLHSWKDLSHSFSCERKEVISHDGVSVPLTILYSREARQKGHSPGLLLGYGAYGEVLDKSWCANRLSLLDRGWVVAFADVRGGSGGDSTWHKSGSGMHKLNSFYDFVACGKYLINEGYVHKDRLGAMTFSAGGLVVGAAINMYPDLFRAAILKVPFLDICNTLLDPSLPLTILDYEEFGDPRVQTQFETIFSYSPYDNIPPGVCHPSMLVTTSFHDSRVGVWEGAKWVAKLRERTCSSCSRSVILKTNMSGGHFGEGGRFSQCEETAFEYAFLMKVTGMLNAEKSGGLL